MTLKTKFFKNFQVTELLSSQSNKDFSKELIFIAFIGKKKKYPIYEIITTKNNIKKTEIRTEDIKKAFNIYNRIEIK